VTPLPDAQHAWDHTLGTDAHGRALAPRFHRLLMLDVRGTPTAADVQRLETALRTLEQRFEHGPSGLLTCLGWGAAWFETHTSLHSPVARPLPMAAWEDPVLEDIHACLHLASDDEARLVQVTEALFGPGPLDQRPRLSLRETRSGFVGRGLVAERVTATRIPADAPLLLGFHSGLRGNQASEEDVTIADGPLAGGTTMQVSRIAIDLERWYAHDNERRAALMYSPATSARDAEALADDAPSNADRLPALAARHGTVGHAQAAGRARLHGRPRINRRDFATLDDGQAGTHFVSLQRSLEDFNATRAVMNAADAGAHHSQIGARHNNGINAFIEVTSRATFAVPPRTQRAFPHLQQRTRT
jgi:deferrochelatase/peroxidase EfeB